MPVLNNVRYASDSDHSRYEFELTLWANIGNRACLDDGENGIACRASLFNNQKNSTVNLVPWLLSTRSIRNSPPICSTKD